MVVVQHIRTIVWVIALLPGLVSAEITGFENHHLKVPPAGLKGQSIETCIRSAASIYDVPEAILYSIGMVESRMNPNAVNVNKNKSEDLGLMQINTGWLPTLEKRGVTRDMLFDHCVSIHVGAWILRGNMNRYDRTWRAVGAYNASSRHPERREAYVRKIQETLKKYGLMEGET
jgi:soluble lytic murein transglycosylase-like protein